MSIDQIKRFSVSRNILKQVVTPLLDSGKVRNPDGMLDLLKKIHSSLWPGKPDGIPLGFSGAVAGYFQELLGGYARAVKWDKPVQFGAINGTGGDLVYEVTCGKHTNEYTSQFKVTASHAGEVRNHIKKAAWQLTGSGGESPQAGSVRVIEVVVQDSSMKEPQGSVAIGDMDSDQWKAQIREALEDGYTQNKIAMSSDDLYLAVQKVYVTTPSLRFIFAIPSSSRDEITFMGGGAPWKQHGFVFSGGGFEKHWRWLTGDYWQSVKYNGYDFPAIRKSGIGSGAPRTPQDLPFQPALA